MFIMWQQFNGYNLQLVIHPTNDVINTLDINYKDNYSFIYLIFY